MRLVTDHAALRYLQRFKGLDLRKLEKEILSGGVREKLKLVKNGPVQANGILFEIKSGVIVTIVKNHRKKAKGGKL